ncbi:hypothetical protein [Streptomyces californicus]|uniref:hypothetical protein n=1 Tax=Streptomyces californicus TaxID=67351 RepID=UPI0036AFCD08
MDSGITDAGGRPGTITVTAGEPGRAASPRLGIRFSSPAGASVWSCAPEAARELAGLLLRAAEEAENAPGDHPVTVSAADLRRGDVRDGARAMTVESARTDGATVHVTWRSGAGRGWTQAYAADAAITLKRRLPDEG